MLLGLDPERAWGERDLLRLMADKCGVSADPCSCLGAGCDRSRADAGRRWTRSPSGSPGLPGGGLRCCSAPGIRTGCWGSTPRLADALSAAGCTVLTPAQGSCVDITTRFGVRTYNLDYVRGVALVREPGVRLTGSATGAHTHSPLPVRAVLEAAAEARAGRCPSWSSGTTDGSAEQVSWASRRSGWRIRMIPALFVGEAEGRVSVVVPLDDAVRSDYYRPLTRYVLNRACLSQ